MNKATGFMKIQRQEPRDMAPLKRIKHWNEFHEHMSDEDIRKQCARCMDCGTPFCHTGILLNNMASGCPINNLIPEWNDLVYKGLWKEAYLRLSKTNHFPEFTGRVCPAPCEGSCTLGMSSPPVTIKNHEVSIIEKAFEKGWVKPEKPRKRTSQKVAVIGSGPAGLSCADQLNRAGHNVTVFERADRIGGLLMYGIPNMKLDKDIIHRRIRLMKKQGIVFKTNTDIGRNYPIKKLTKEFQAIVLCTGATKPRDLPVPGRALKGIHFAMDFLGANTRRLLDSERAAGRQNTGGHVSPDDFIHAKGKDVIVIGGGDTGTDCVGTSLRHGCKSLVQFEILPRPPAEREAGNPWPQWPKIDKMDYGQEEAAALYGQDPRHYLIMTKKFVGEEEGFVKEVHTVQIEWVRNDKGRFVPKEIPGTEKIWPAQLVFLAMGFLGPEDSLLKQLAVEQDLRSNIKTGPGQYATNVPGVFSAGDCRRGQSLVVWAIHEGSAAAAECDQYLKSDKRP